MRLGIMGGTFDPIHYGHLFVAEEARHRFHLEEVLFVPNGTPPHKDSADLSSAQHRCAMVRLAIQQNARFRLCTVEIDREGPSYTIDTLVALHDLYPGSALFYITGIDAIAQMLTWRRQSELTDHAVFVAASRHGFSTADLASRLPQPLLARIRVMEAPTPAISSTQIRERIRSGMIVRYLIPDAVLDYVIANNLYNTGSRRLADPGPGRHKKET